MTPDARQPRDPHACPFLHGGNAVACESLDASLLPLHPMPVRPTPWRWGLASLGLLCFAIGAIGAVTPLVPTTGPVLLGSFLLTRSCPWLEERLLRTRLFAPYARFVRSAEPLSRRVRVGAWTGMWLSLLISLGALWLSGALAGTRGVVLTGVMLLVGLIGTIVIARFRRASKVATDVAM